MAIGNYSHSRLLALIRQQHQAEEAQQPPAPAGSNTQLQYNNNGDFGGISTFTFDGTDMKVADDTKIKFGTNSDAHIEYNENGDDFLVISGSANGIVLSGSTIQIAGTLEGAFPLRSAERWYLQALGLPVLLLLDQTQRQKSIMKMTATTT